MGEIDPDVNPAASINIVSVGPVAQEALDLSQFCRVGTNTGLVL